jgi:hypothetical protein
MIKKKSCKETEQEENSCRKTNYGSNSELFELVNFVSRYCFNKFEMPISCHKEKPVRKYNKSPVPVF